MDESAALEMLARSVDDAGDDAAVVDSHVLTTDMLHDSTDFPDGVTRYTAGWRSAAASLSDVAAMGAEAVAVVAVYAAPAFDPDELREFVSGAKEVCQLTGADYVGGDLDTHPEFTVVTTALGRANQPIYRSGARAGDTVYVTGTFGRSAAAIEQFERGDTDRGNELFQFVPRVRDGLVIGTAATAMIDSSDGLARSLHQLAAASDCGFAIEGDRVPVHPAIEALDVDRDEITRHFGEDFELVFTAPREAIEAVAGGIDVALTAIGDVTEDEVTLDGESLANRGYEHGTPRE